MAMPVMAGAAMGVGEPPPAAHDDGDPGSPSMGFMLPVATPPNALVFGSGYITIPQMARAGFWLDLIGVVVVTVVSTLIVRAVLVP